jgi:arginase
VAVKIVRQSNQIALLGAPVSAAASAPGGEGAPAALRSAGLVSRLQSIGYEVADHGDDPQQLFQPDNDSPRARNLSRVLLALEALRPRVEVAAKSGALPVILGGDCSMVLATVAGLRRYYRQVSVIYADCDADLQTPATTTSGCVDGMVVSHLVGRGASELVRFWSEPPLVREPDVALFGVARLDPAEERAMEGSPLRRYLAEDVRRKSPAKAASEAIERTHADGHGFVLHFDVDVIAGFPATNLPNSGGLSLEEVREAFEVFAAQKHLAAIQVGGYNPLNDADGSGAKLIIDFLAHILQVRKDSLKEAAAAAAAPPKPAVEPAVEEAKAPEAPAPSVADGEEGSSDMLEEGGAPDSSADAEAPAEANMAESGESEEPSH